MFRYGRPEILEWAFEELKDKHPAILRTAALGFARGGHLDFLLALIALKPLKKALPLCTEAAAGGHVHVLKSLNKYGLYPEYGDSDDMGEEYNDTMHFKVGKHGQLNALKYIVGIEDFFCIAYNGAATGGHLNIIKWLIDNGHHYPEEISGFNYGVGRGGNVQILELLLEKWETCGGSLTDGASEGGHLNFLKQLESKKMLDITNNTVICAARGGNIQVMKYLLEKGAKLDAKSLQTAIDNGQLEMAKWMLENGCSLENISIKTAAGKGYLKIVKWALENRCKYEANAALSAVNSGQLRVVEYLHTNGFELHEKCFIVALEIGHLNIVQYLSKTMKFPENAFDLAVKSGDLDVVKWLYENGCATSKNAPTIAARCGYLYILKWLRTKGFQFDKSVFEAASQGRKEEEEEEDDNVHEVIEDSDEEEIDDEEIEDEEDSDDEDYKEVTVWQWLSKEFPEQVEEWNKS